MALFTPLQARWCLHPVVISALVLSYSSGATWDEAMRFTLGVCYGVDDPSLRPMLGGFRKSYEATRTTAQHAAVQRIFEHITFQSWYEQMRTNVGFNFGFLGISSIRTEYANVFKAESSRHGVRFLKLDSLMLSGDASMLIVKIMTLRTLESIDEYDDNPFETPLGRHLTAILLVVLA